MHRHEATGWDVDPDTGTVYGGRWQRRAIGYVNGAGYVGSYASHRRHFLFHRVVWEVVHGPIPDGLEINHLNGVKTDNRLSNLELTTPGGNMRHAYATGLRSRRGGSVGLSGVDHHAAKLSPDIAAEIREALRCGATQREAARRFGVSQKTVWAISSNLRWTD